MRFDYNQKHETINDERKRITKPRKNRNAQKKGNLQISRKIGNIHNQISGDERKKLK